MEKYDEKLIEFLSNNLIKSDRCVNTAYWLLPEDEGLRLSEVPEGFDSEEHFAIYRTLNEYYYKNKDPIYNKMYDPYSDSFAAIVFDKCFNSYNPMYECPSEALSLPVRFVQENANAIKLRCNESLYHTESEMNLELNLAQEITDSQKNQLRKLWCDKRNKNENAKFFFDIVYPNSKDYYWKHNIPKYTFENFREFLDDNEDLSDIQDFSCEFGMEKVITTFEKIQKEYLSIQKSEKEYMMDEERRRENIEKKKRIEESQKLLKFHDEWYYKS